MNEERGGSKFLGRDHHPHCFTIWLAGGGMKAGHVHGETDELGYFVTKDKVDVHDLQATILHLLGLDAKRFSFPYQGLNQRLIGPTDEARLIAGVLASACPSAEWIKPPSACSKSCGTPGIKSLGTGWCGSTRRSSRQVRSATLQGRRGGPDRRNVGPGGVHCGRRAARRRWPRTTGMKSWSCSAAAAWATSTRPSTG